MKILKIENNNGYFFALDTKEWEKIDEIDAKSLMRLLEYFLKNEVEMDEPEVSILSNQAHLIIYQSIYNKLKELEQNKSKFKDESERTYWEEIKKYSGT